MPHWDFRCATCDIVKDLQFSSFTAAQTATCATCGGLLDRLASASLVKFEGTGFHCNDYPEVRVRQYGAK